MCSFVVFFLFYFFFFFSLLFFRRELGNYTVLAPEKGIDTIYIGKMGISTILSYDGGGAFNDKTLMESTFQKQCNKFQVNNLQRTTNIPDNLDHWAPLLQTISWSTSQLFQSSSSYASSWLPKTGETESRASVFPPCVWFLPDLTEIETKGTNFQYSLEDLTENVNPDIFTGDFESNRTTVDTMDTTDTIDTTPDILEGEEYYDKVFWDQEFDLVEQGLSQPRKKIRK